ncbi:hypothetical protein N9X77_06520 [Luminiphilus sp.]|nr:hypothetical protein [Luminiphilus sp.]
MSLSASSGAATNCVAQTLIIVKAKSKPAKSSRRNHLTFLETALARYATVVKLQPSFLNFFTVLRFFFRDRRNICLIAFPNSTVGLFFVAILSLTVQRSFCLSWRMSPPKGRFSKIKFFIEKKLINFIGRFLFICEEQVSHNAIGSEVKDQTYLPALTYRQKKPASFCNEVLWCGGGSDRAEREFINTVEKNYRRGIRSSSNERALANFGLYQLPSNITTQISDPGEQPRGFDIFLKINNTDNPAGLTSLYENLYAGQRYLVSPHLTLPGAVVDGDLMICTTQTITQLLKQYKNAIRTLLRSV